MPLIRLIIFFSRDNTKVVVGCSDGKLLIYDVTIVCDDVQPLISAKVKSLVPNKVFFLLFCFKAVALFMFKHYT